MRSSRFSRIVFALSLTVAATGCQNVENQKLAVPSALGISQAQFDAVVAQHPEFFGETNQRAGFAIPEGAREGMFRYCSVGNGFGMDQIIEVAGAIANRDSDPNNDNQRAMPRVQTLVETFTGGVQSDGTPFMNVASTLDDLRPDLTTDDFCAGLKEVLDDPQWIETEPQEIGALPESQTVASAETFFDLTDDLGPEEESAPSTPVAAAATPAPEEVHTVAMTFEEPIEPEFSDAEEVAEAPLVALDDTGLLGM